MPKTSILIPSRNELFLVPTVDDIFNKATGEIEVIVYADGATEYGLPEERPGLTILQSQNPIGMRPSINAAAAAATGDFFLKCDGHCMFAEGFDEELVASCDQDWVMIPRRYSLDPVEWTRRKKTPVDYHYLGLEFNDRGEATLHGRWWRQRGRDRAEITIDDEMSSQGSCWFMSRRHFRNFLGGLRVEGYGDFIQEFQEIGMKTWLGGGAVKVNKNTWYAHLHKGKTWGRGYYVSSGSWASGLSYSSDFWLNDRWSGRVHNFDWFIEKFWPVPTWPDDWRKRIGYI